MTRWPFGWLGAAVCAVLAVRLATLGLYPLMDTTEARYGEIARVMVTSGNWVTPQLVPGEPFWAKPPLSIWQSAGAIALLGDAAFAARLPALLNTALTLALLAVFAARVVSRPVAGRAALIAVSTLGGFVAAGTVMTDPALLASLTLTLTSFWFALHQRGVVWRLVFFASLGLGLLAKGPVATVLAAGPIGLWTVLQWRWREVLALCLWPPGLALAAAVAAPWYLVAEIRTPGFLRYFLVGEHLQRYLQSGWSGDRYGTAHDEPLGTIWVYALLACLPWSLVALGVGARAVAVAGPAVRRALGRALNQYLLCWALWPLVFFTFAGNILATYVLPGVPAFALLLAMAVSTWRARTVVAVAAVVPLGLVLALTFGLRAHTQTESQARLLHAVQRAHPGVPVLYLRHAPHSARFYSRGTARFLLDSAAVHNAVRDGEPAVLVVRHGDGVDLPLDTLAVVHADEEYTAFLLPPR
ncbi:MAG: phospholipid carrier-dependent glycosyltransferase [Pseudomonadota bacterium]